MANYMVCSRLDKTAVDTRVNFYDAETNELLEEQVMGPQASGMIGFQWTDLPQAYRDGNKTSVWM